MIENPKKAWCRRNLDNVGAAAVELAIVLPVVIVMVLGVVDYGGVMNTIASLLGATRSATEYAKANWDNPAIDAAAGTVQQVCMFWGAARSGGSCSPVTPSVSGSCTCVDGTAVTCPTPTGSNPCLAETDPRVLVYVSATASDAFTPILSVASFVFPNPLVATATTRLQ